MKRERLGRNLVIANGVVKCLIKRAGRFHEWTSPLQGISAYSTDKDGEKTPKAALVRWLAQCEKSITDKRWEAIKETHIRRGSVTIGGLIAAYEAAAERRRMVSEVPQESSVRLSLSRLRMIVKGCGLTESDGLSKLTPAAIDQWIEKRVAKFTTAKRPKEKALATAVQLLNSARAVLSYWALEDYRRTGVEIPECVLQWPHPAVTWKQQYKDPPRDLKLNTLKKAELLRKDNVMVWVLFHVLISFGCRPGDALRLTWDNFKMLPGPEGKLRRCLVYRPHKTSNKNNKLVVQPVPDRVWDELEAAVKQCKEDSDYVVPTVRGNRGRATILEDLNKWLRGIGWTKDKYHSGAYNLRGLFTSAVLNAFGEQVASDFCGSSVAMVRKHYGALYTDKLPEIDTAKVIGA